MSPHIDTSVAEIERAAFQLRRLWAKPHLLQRLREQCGHGGRPIQLSSLLVIHAIAGYGEGDDDVTVGAVADYLDIDPSTASRLVGHAIDAGFVSRSPSPVDARRAHLRLTEAGDRVRGLTDDFRQRFIAQLVADWTDGERREFARLLGRFAEAAANFPMESTAFEPPEQEPAQAAARCED
ncbi:MarR family winged helix-turn-helix transcriptional regulator [Actinomadura sp. DC4]|uniref:MarR family winged helix-turn-helix transcriptional regulator n=1 Tax=Actinomadura sp. DC4 TaxID=3055069 RepID=UPI0025AEFDF5|nr:MarR family winged helix-turn-helix transcriptional regulator [Actinomadura sp. DC4]MDN3359983.1 MarR family winged helix-turn-helix transcriptional regulator [Actinomadura sp. DC4]